MKALTNLASVACLLTPCSMLPGSFELFFLLKNQFHAHTHAHDFLRVGSKVCLRSLAPVVYRNRVVKVLTKVSSSSSFFPWPADERKESHWNWSKLKSSPPPPGLIDECLEIGMDYTWLLVHTLTHTKIAARSCRHKRSSGGHGQKNRNGAISWGGRNSAVHSETPIIITSRTAEENGIGRWETFAGDCVTVWWAVSSVWRMTVAAVWMGDVDQSHSAIEQRRTDPRALRTPRAGKSSLPDESFHLARLDGQWHGN